MLQLHIAGEVYEWADDEALATLGTWRPSSPTTTPWRAKTLTELVPEARQAPRTPPGFYYPHDDHAMAAALAAMVGGTVVAELDDDEEELPPGAAL